MLAFVFSALSLLALEPTSTYTELDNCVEIHDEEVAGAIINQRCEGYAGWPVYLAASEHSSSLAYSERGKQAQFAERPLRSGLFQSFSDTIEWRLGDNGAPFATIHRWRAVAPVIDPDTGAFTGETERFGEELVVTALLDQGDLGACHIAYIDATEVRQANELARIIADAWGPDARCDGRAPFRVDAATAEFLFADQADSE